MDECLIMFSWSIYSQFPQLPVLLDMGRISNFHGQMQTKISFLVGGMSHKATMFREKFKGADMPDVEKETYVQNISSKDIIILQNQLNIIKVSLMM